MENFIVRGKSKHTQDPQWVWTSDKCMGCVWKVLTAVPIQNECLVHSVKLYTVKTRNDKSMTAREGNMEEIFGKR